MISIVIPVLNEASTIAATLERTNSLDGDFEIIVVDGGSTDGTALIASRYANVIQGPRGRARQMNAGASEARGDVLLFLHADTLLPQGAIAGVEQALRDSRVTGGRFKVRLGNSGTPYRLIAFAINLRDRLFGGFTGDQGIFVRAGVFRALGGYRDMPLMEDLDFGRRLGAAGKISRLPVGTDIPTLQPGHIEQAVECLHASDLCLGPSTDGGYYLIGASKAHPFLSDGIPWSTGTVLNNTIEKARASNLSLALLDAITDIDTAGDLAWLCAEIERLKQTEGAWIARYVEDELGYCLPSFWIA